MMSESEGVYRKVDGELEEVDTVARNVGGEPDQRSVYKKADGELVEIWPALPDSAVNQWAMVERSDTTIEDFIGSNNGTANGTTNTSNNYYEGWAEDADGTDDQIAFSALPTSTINDDWAFAITIDGFNSSSREVIFNNEDSGSNRTPQVIFQLSDTNSGDLRMLLRGSSGNPGAVITDSGGHVDDSSKHRVVFNKVSNSVSDWEIWVDNTNVSSSVDMNEDWSNVDSAADQNTYLFVREDQGSFKEWCDAIADNAIVYENALSDSEVDGDYNVQPWT